MWSDPWAVVAEADRAQWRRIPLESVGPLRFGVSSKEAVAAMKGLGFTCEPAGVGAGLAHMDSQALSSAQRGDRPLEWP